MTVLGGMHRDLGRGRREVDKVNVQKVVPVQEVLHEEDGVDAAHVCGVVERAVLCGFKLGQCGRATR